MTTMSEGQRDRIRAAAHATTEPTPGVMPAWVRNKPHCRWAWRHWPNWRRLVETETLSSEARANLVSGARVCYAAELRRRREEDAAISKARREFGIEESS